jgi:DNA primase
MFLLREPEIKELLVDSGVHIVYETDNDYVCLCPFHWNKHSPSMTVSKSKGIFNCFNPQCGATGDLLKIIMSANKMTYFEAARLLESKEISIEDIVQDVVDAATEPLPAFEPFDQAVIDETVKAFPGSPAESYMLKRGFNEDTLGYFSIGFLKKDGAVTVPVHSPDGQPMGMVGRVIDHKQFLNTKGLKAASTLWNIHRARLHGDSVIITEASFDAMKVHQAGHPNVVALLKGALSKGQANLLERTFNSVVIFVDNDDPMDYTCTKCMPRCLGHPPGAEIAKKINNRLGKNMNVYAVPYSLYNGKDATDMTSDEINRAIRGATFYGLDFDNLT